MPFGIIPLSVCLSSYNRPLGHYLYHQREDVRADRNVRCWTRLGFSDTDVSEVLGDVAGVCCNGHWCVGRGNRLDAKKCQARICFSD